MSDVLMVYWSGTGNTKKMADLIEQGIKDGGKTVDVKEVSEVAPDAVDGYANVVLGCPSMGAEVLEEAEMDPFVSDIESRISGKKVALFGSYGWGSGEWMEDWQSRMDDAGANMIFSEGCIVNEEPSGDTEDQCVDYGKQIAASI